MPGGNEEKTRTSWSPSTLIETLFTQLNAYQIFAAKGNGPIMDTQTIYTSVQIVENNGLFDLTCRKWHVKYSASCTMTGFKMHFRKAE